MNAVRAYTPGSEPEEEELFEAKQTFMSTVFYGPLYPRNVHIHSGGGTILRKKIKLLKIRFPIPSKNVLIVHIEKKIENS